MTDIDRQLHKIVIDTIPEKLKFSGLVPCRRCGWCPSKKNIRPKTIEMTPTKYVL